MAKSINLLAMFIDVPIVGTHWFLLESSAKPCPGLVWFGLVWAWVWQKRFKNHCKFAQNVRG